MASLPNNRRIGIKLISIAKSSVDQNTVSRLGMIKEGNLVIILQSQC